MRAGEKYAILGLAFLFLMAASSSTSLTVLRMSMFALWFTGAVLAWPIQNEIEEEKTDDGTS